MNNPCKVKYSLVNIAFTAGFLGAFTIEYYFGSLSNYYDKRNIPISSSSSLKPEFDKYLGVKIGDEHFLVNEDSLSSELVESFGNLDDLVSR